MFSLGRGDLKYSKKRDRYEASNMIVASDGSYSLSYGWFFMHRTFMLGKKKFVIENACTYSPTTSNHFNKLHRHFNYNLKPDLVVYDNTGLRSLVDTIQSINNDIKDNIVKLNTPGLRKTTKEKALQSIENLYKQLKIVKRLNYVY